VATQEDDGECPWNPQAAKPDALSPYPKEWSICGWRLDLFPSVHPQRHPWKSHPSDSASRSAIYWTFPCDYSGTAGIGATQIAGGYLNGSPTNTTGLGGFGYGGNRVGGNGGGGGGGWYGGGGATSSSTTVHSGGGGGGGSSYISGHEGCIAITSAGSPKVQTYSKLSDSISHTGYTFVNTQMIDGAGYPWTTVKSGATSGMPSPTGILTQTGQAGDGYAIIHYLGE